MLRASPEGGAKMNTQPLRRRIVGHGAESKLEGQPSAGNESKNDKDLPDTVIDDHKEEGGLICFGESRQQMRKNEQLGLLTRFIISAKVEELEKRRSAEGTKQQCTRRA
jgi:hypothetical protein